MLVSCSTTKFVKEGEYLLDKVEIKVDSADIKGADLTSYLRQRPNNRIFGILNWPLHLYSLSGRSDHNWLNKQLRRAGEPPVIMDTTLIEQSSRELQRYFVNKGYTDAEARFVVDTSKRKKAVVTYQVQANAPYRIGEYTMNIPDPRIDSIARLTAPRRSRFASMFRSTPEWYTPVMGEGDLFDRDNLDKERERISTLLRRRGYYAFNRDYIGYLADSTAGSHLVDLELIVKPFRYVSPDGAISEKPHRQYYINKVSIVTDYDPLNPEENSLGYSITDSIRKGVVSILYGKNGRSIRPGVLERSNFIQTGSLFNEREVEQTYASLGSLRALHNINIRFNEFEENDSLKLDATILTSPAKRQTFGVDLEGTNSAGDLGFASSLNYQHRNLFRGAEVFSARIRGAYETITGASSAEEGYNDYWELGGDLSMVFPQFLFPFISSEFSRKIRATTEVKVSYSQQRRPEYRRAILSGSWSYNWQDRSNVLARHTFNLLDIDYVYLPYINQSFKDSLPESTQLYNYTDQFIFSTGYTYSFNNYNPLQRQRNTHSLRVSFELAGNFLYAMSKLTGASKDENGRYKLFDINYSQYVKGDIDFGKSIVLDDRNSVAFHIGGGIGIPYGNAKEMPFERRYFAGGANSNRGWSVRSLGPGRMPRSQNRETSFALQTGDIRLDMSAEYRSKLFWKFEMAAFVDAGNIWTIRKYEHQPEGNFDFSRFYQEIAVSYGLGLRLNFDYFLIRLDGGLKVFDPQESGGRKWAILRPNLGDNFALHFAVGYPF